MASANPAGHVIVCGRVSNHSTRNVPAREAKEGYRDENDVYRWPVEARDAYDVHEVSILTDKVEGGFILVLVHEDDWTPINKGDEVAWVVRPYASRERSRNGWFNRVNLYYVRDAAGLAAGFRGLFESTTVPALKTASAS